MSAFDAGAIIFRIQSAGAQLLQRDMAEADASFKKVKQSADGAKPAIDGVGTSTEQTGKKAAAVKAPLDGAAKSTKGLGDAAGEASKKQAQQAALTEKQIAAAKQLGATLLAGGVAIGAVVGLSVAKFTQFDKAMSNTGAAVMATKAQQKELADAALDAGAKTAYSATEAANAEEELAKAGQSVTTIVGGSLNGALSLAAAGQLEVARSAEVMATAITQFGLKGSDAAHVADVLSAGAGKAQGSVDDLANALKFVGPVAHSMGWSLEESTGILAEFASQGIIGEQAGTSLRGVLSSLTSPSQLAAQTMKKYGVELYNANGSMKSGSQVAQQLHDAFADLTDQERQQALGRIFGNEQITAATILMDGGAKAVEKWTAAVTDSGYATEQASKRQDNLAGDIEKLGGSFDSAAISMGAAADGPMRLVVQTATEMVDAFHELPDWAQQAGLGVAGIGSAALIAYGGALVLVPKMVELNKAAKELGPFTQKAASGLSKLGIGLGTVVAVVAAVSVLAQWAEQIKGTADAAEQAVAHNENLADSLKRVQDGFEFGNLKGAFKSLVTLQENGWSRISAVWDQNMRDAVDLQARLGDLDGSLGDLAKSNLPAAEAQFQKWAEATDGSKKQLSALLDSLPTFKEALQDSAKASGYVATDQELLDLAMGKTTKTTEANARAVQHLAGIATGASDDISDLADEIRGFGKAQFDVDDANREFQQAIDDATAALKQNGKTLDEHTQQGRDNADAAEAIAKATLDVVASQAAQGASEDVLKQKMQEGRDAVVNTRIAMGESKEEAERYADKLGLIPANVTTAVKLNTSLAQSALNYFIRTNDGRSIGINVRAEGQGFASIPGIKKADGGIVDFYGNGGVSEHHEAQFARAGAWRVWAEPETGGEAYIPLSPAKRATSVPVLAETASRLGFDIVPSGAPRLADGSLATPASLPPEPSIARKGTERPVELHIHNPVTRDLLKEAWEAAQIIGYR